MPAHFASLGQGEGLSRAEGKVKTGLKRYVIAQGVGSGLYSSPKS